MNEVMEGNIERRMGGRKDMKINSICVINSCIITGVNFHRIGFLQNLK